MNNEIKEILDRLERIDHKEYSCGFEFADIGSFDEDCRCFEERKKMANYITNLQKENTQLKIQLLEKKCSDKDIEYKEKIKLQQRIDKAIELLNNPWSFESGNKEVDEITYNKKRKVIDILKEVSE